MDVLPELKAYLTKKRWRFKTATEGNLAIQTCPFCGRSKWKFWVHAQKTIYRCWHCDARGNLYKLKRELGDLGGGIVSAAQLSGDEKSKAPGKPIDMKLVEKWHRQLLRHQEAMRYVTEGRGLLLETIKFFKLGLQKQHGHLWLAIPHISGGVCYNVKFRALPPAPKAFRRVKGAASVLFNADALGEATEIVIAEAETDAMSMWQAGIKNVVGLTCGADTFLPEWYDQLADKEKILLALDADAVGQQGARSIARRLGFDKCFNLMLPSHDANEMLVQFGGQELARAIGDGGERFEVAGVITIADALLRCKEANDSAAPGILTPWSSVNRQLGKGWQPGDLVVLSAKIKVGKTTWALNVAHHNSMQDSPSLIYCLEMSTERLAGKIAATVRRKSVDELGPVDYSMTRYHLRRQPLYFVEPDWAGSFKLEAVVDKIRESVKRYGIKLLVFDHLHFLCRSLQYVTAEVGQVTRAFKLLAEELHIVVILIAQPRKIQGDRIIKYDDIKDSSAIPADADQVILLHRNARPAGFDGEVDDVSELEVLEPKTMVRIDAARFRGGGECFLYYDGATSTFYNWDDRPVKEA